MNRKSKLLINTLTLYLKIGVTCVVQLLATRIALSKLGADSFGLYNLIAGVIVMLSFLNGALLISVQRFLSYAIGEKNDDKLKSIFNVSFAIHFCLALLVGIAFLLLQPLLFRGFLNVPSELHRVAVQVYSLMIISSVVTLLIIPYSAVINAREDMWFDGIVEIVGCGLKLWAAFSLFLVSDNLLIVYTIFMVLSVLVVACMKVVWCKFKYREVSLSLSLMKDKVLAREMVGFVGWNTLGSAAVVVRNQGLAVLLNVFFSTAINAAYGVASQVNSLVLSFATTLTAVFTPMIVQKKGEGDISGMIKAARLSSKMSFLLSSMLAIPILVFIDDIFAIWLNVIPEYSRELTFWIVISFVITQLTPGINRAIYASGNIKWYQIWTSVCLIANIPLGYLLLSLGCEPYSVIVLMAALQIISTFITIYYAKKYCELEIKLQILEGVLKPMGLFLIFLLGTYLLSKRFLCSLTIMELLLVSALCAMSYAILYYLVVLSKNEKTLVSYVLRIKK